ncbi:P-loop containing nucleoside triphosphate hydrolase protein [Trichophaea hybrida]|nr:P-loop containing nucleoside triphosphate hydrolase protein [Trichophaea hybrida]
MSSSSSISVVVRVRPFSIREAAQLSRIDDSTGFFGDGSFANTPKPTLSGKGVRRVVKVVDERMLIFDPAEENPMARYQKTILPQGKRVKDMRFGFDRVFDETCSQQDVYEATTKSLLDSVLDGFNATVFAYGATGCGKTHTISGNPQHPGIIFLTCAELFERIEALHDEKEVSLTLSYLEIYNETIRDLLVPGGSKLGLQLREDNNQNISVSGLSQRVPATVEEVMDIIVMGNANRTQSPTEANATSSRSHAVLQINVTQKPRTAGVSEDHMASTLSIIDLAGSERASVTKNRGERLLEGANINRSLLALGNCINSLCDPRSSNHVPYRDSKLTRLLKFSLGGNCKTVMIVCVSPSSQHYDETHNTLKYANRAKNIKTKVSRNIINVNRHVSQYVKAIYDLRQEVESLKSRLKDSTKEAIDKINKQRAVKDMSMKDGMRRLKASYEQTKEARAEKISLLLNLRLIEHRISLVTAWLDAFDQIFESRQHEEPPVILFQMRSEADKVLRELTNNEQLIKQRVAGLGWERVIDTALQNSMRSLQTIEGVTEGDIAALNTEANLLRMTGERDVLHAITIADIDVSKSMHSLAKAHFETYATIYKIMNTDISGAEALEEARKSLFDIQKGAGDVVSHIIKPSGELVSQEAYQPSAIKSPKKKHTGYGAGYSPFKTNHVLSMPPPVSPMRSPRPIKAKSPRKGVLFSKKVGEKKRVRWNEELEDPVSEDSKRRVVIDDSYFSGVPASDEDMALLPPQPSFQPAGRAYSPPAEPAYVAVPQGVSAPPIRPRNKMLEPLGTKKPQPSENSQNNSLENSPLHSFDPDQVTNRLNAEMAEEQWRDSKPAIHRGALRKSMAGGMPSRQVKRRSPSNSSQTSPEGASMWKTSYTKRLPSKGEKENGSVTTVLSPRSTGIKAAARRMTVNPAGVQGLSALTQAGLPALLGAGREGLAVGDKRVGSWK